MITSHALVRNIEIKIDNFMVAVSYFFTSTLSKVAKIGILNPGKSILWLHFFYLLTDTLLILSSQLKSKFRVFLLQVYCFTQWKGKFLLIYSRNDMLSGDAYLLLQSMQLIKSNNKMQLLLFTRVFIFKNGCLLNQLFDEEAYL